MNRFDSFPRTRHFAIPRSPAAGERLSHNIAPRSFCCGSAMSWRGVACDALVIEANIEPFVGHCRSSRARAGTPAPQCGTGVLARQITENSLEIGQTPASTGGASAAPGIGRPQNVAAPGSPAARDRSPPGHSAGQNFDES